MCPRQRQRVEIINRGPESSRNFQRSFCTWFQRGVISQSRSLNLKWASTSGAALTVALIAYSELEELCQGIPAVCSSAGGSRAVLSHARITSAWLNGSMELDEVRTR